MNAEVSLSFCWVLAERLTTVVFLGWLLSLTVRTGYSAATEAAFRSPRPAKESSSDVFSSVVNVHQQVGSGSHHGLSYTTNQSFGIELGLSDLFQVRPHSKAKKGEPTNVTTLNQSDCNICKLLKSIQNHDIITA